MSNCMEFPGLPVGWGTVSHISDKTGYIASTGISSTDSEDIRRRPEEAHSNKNSPSGRATTPPSFSACGTTARRRYNYTVEDAIQYASLTINSNYVLYSTACLLVYEVFTSLDDEVARVWSLKWRLPKLLFIFNRYVIRAILISLWILMNYLGTSSEFCGIYSYLQMIPLRLAILAAQALVVIRVWALYNNSRLIFWVLTILYTLEVVGVTLCLVVATLDTEAAAQPAPLSCGLVSRSGNLLTRYPTAIWFAPICFEFIIIVLTVAKLFPQWEWGGKGRLFGSGGNTTIDVLARDSLIYFGFIFTCTLTTAIMDALTFPYHSILLTPTAAVSCIAVSRMTINIGASLDNPTSAGAMSDLLFAEHTSHE
ncbi:hypothetical protein B0H13DRAFT_2341536 [Mycena leptocephala]|nr:hypothetical protein B0H13DRAFT_2341536 [Mycena leptocephala]